MITRDDFAMNKIRLVIILLSLICANSIASAEPLQFVKVELAPTTGIFSPAVERDETETLLKTDKQKL
jgi:hypothetical protein